MISNRILLGVFLALLISPSYAQTWSAVGDGVRGRVAAMVEYNGELYVSGQGFFSSSSHIGIVKWNGTAFEALPGLEMFGTHRIEAMAVHDGELFVGGAFESASGAFGSISHNVARWDGSTWSVAGEGFDNVVYSFGFYQGELYAGGDFDASGTIPCPSIARWDGDQWASLNTVFANGGRIFAIEEYNGDLYVAGNFWAWNTWSIARWDGATWNTLGGSGIQIGLYDIEAYAGELAVAGVNYFEASGTPVNGMASWNGTSWTSLDSYGGNPEQLALSLATYHDELYVGGDFSTMGGSPIKGIARYDGTAWSAVGSGVDSTGINVDTLILNPWDTLFIEAPHRVYAMMEYQGDLYVGGEFNMIGGVEAHDIAKWNLPVGMTEAPGARPLLLFPDPARDELFIRNAPSATAYLELCDALGRMVARVRAPVEEVDVSGLSAGSYLLTTLGKDGQRLAHARFVKQ